MLLYTRFLKDLIVFILCTFLFLSCTAPVEPGKTETNVYVAGFESNFTHTVAKYWANGTEVILSDGTADASANAIVVSGSDVYSAGKDGNYAGYWKNKTFVKLNDGSSPASASSILISGGDIYVTGYDDSTAVYWKNNSKYMLQASIGFSEALSISVVNGDVYCAGYDSNRAVYWKNGEKFILSKDNSPSAACGIAVSGSNVYITGYSASYARVWINGVDSTYWKGWAAGLWYDGQDFYSCGAWSPEEYSSIQGICAKNGKTCFTADSHSEMNSVYTAGGNIYCAGDRYLGLYGGTQIAVYWKNGKATDLTDGSKMAMAKAIFVKEN